MLDLCRELITSTGTSIESGWIGGIMEADCTTALPGVTEVPLATVRDGPLFVGRAAFALPGKAAEPPEGCTTAAFFAGGVAPILGDDTLGGSSDFRLTGERSSRGAAWDDFLSAASAACASRAS